VATLILTDANLQKKMSTSQAKEVEKEVAVLLQEQYQELVSKLPDPTDRARYLDTHPHHQPPTLCVPDRTLSPILAYARRRWSACSRSSSPRRRR
jgi:hypothetical protein